MSSSLAACDLSLSVGGRRILGGVNFSVKAGEFVAVAGQNGAGKSTLLRCLCRVVGGYEGDVLIDGVSTSSMTQREIARRAAYMPQTCEAAHGFTVREFVETARYPWGRPFSGLSAEDIEAVGRALSVTMTAHLADRQTDSLSGGERQRVMLASAVAQGAQVLLLDEPATFLDCRHQADMLYLIRSLHASGMTIIAVTHDLNFALHSADRIMVLGTDCDDGSAGSRIVRDGSAEELAEPGVLEGLFGTEFMRFRRGGCSVPFVIPAAFAEGSAAS